jgi:hypothetical protein
MYSIEYKFKNVSSDESRNLNNQVTNIKKRDMSSFWECDAIESITMEIEFERSTINMISIMNKSCEVANITLKCLVLGGG